MKGIAASEEGYSTPSTVVWTGAFLHRPVLKDFSLIRLTPPGQSWPVPRQAESLSYAATRRRLRWG